MENKTYDTRLMELSTQMAKESWDEVQPMVNCKWDTDFLNEADKEQLRYDCLPLARIALKHMATMYIIGFTDGIRKESNIELMGLIEPQTT